MFLAYPKAQKCSAAAARIMLEAVIVEAGAPENCIGWIEHPSAGAAKMLMAISRVSLDPGHGRRRMGLALLTAAAPAPGSGRPARALLYCATADLKRAVKQI